MVHFKTAYLLAVAALCTTSLAKVWDLYLGEFTFDAGSNGSVTLARADNDCYRGKFLADAVVFDLPKEQWPDIDTTQPEQPVDAGLALSRPVQALQSIIAVDVYTVQGRKFAQVSANQWRALKRRLPAKAYVIRELDAHHLFRHRKIMLK